VLIWKGSFILALVLVSIIISYPPLNSKLEGFYPTGVERLANGNLLITCFYDGKVIEVSPEGNVIWVKKGIRYPNGARRLSNGDTAIALYHDCVIKIIGEDGEVRRTIKEDANYRPVNIESTPDDHIIVVWEAVVADGEAPKERVVKEYDTEGREVWSSDGLSVRCPRDAIRTSDGGYLFALHDTNRVVEFSAKGIPGSGPVWEISDLIKKDGSSRSLSGVEEVSHLPNGNILVVEVEGIKGCSRITEIDREGCVVWEVSYPGVVMDVSPCGEDDGGWVFLADWSGRRVVEVDRGGEVVWSLDEVEFNDGRVNIGLDLRGGMRVVLEVDLSDIRDSKEKRYAVNAALEIIRNRVDEFGVSEPSIHPQGTNRIVVQLPGIKDPDRAIDLIGRTALLEFKLVEEVKDYSDIPPDCELKVLRRRDGIEERLVIKKKAELTGKYLVGADVTFDELNNPMVSLEFNREGTDIFSEVTGSHIGERLAIVLDGVVRSAPNISTRIPNGRAVIEGDFTLDEARDLAIVLRAGALPAPIRIVENRTVGPTLGQDSINKGVFAAVLGSVLVVVFMVVYYKVSGVIATVAFLLNFIIILAALAILGATLTLPGIAGIILTIGMSVDANVIIFERIKEELRAGKTVRMAIEMGYKNAFRTILDANLTTLLTAIVLYYCGTGPIKGFAVTLSIGIGASMFTALFVSRVLFDFLTLRPSVERISI
jgi:preprotein translocase subunit SecD